jgi:2-keto-4-pentenoate hydratase/2-oxohepta-3-ene-1,7-dioic acid hydratase in catechol pathway
MKVVTFAQGNQLPRPGVLESEKVYDITEYGFRSTLELIEGDTDALKAIRGLANSKASYALDEIHLLAPIQRPPRIFAVGLNYQEHAAESKMAVQMVPTVFMKLPSSVTGPDTEVILPKNSAQPDYEAELAVVSASPDFVLPRVTGNNMSSATRL